MREADEQVIYEKMSDEEYRKALMEIFKNMDNKRLCYYYNYILAYEKE